MVNTPTTLKPEEATSHRVANLGYMLCDRHAIEASQRGVESHQSRIAKVWHISMTNRALIYTKDLVRVREEIKQKTVVWHGSQRLEASEHLFTGVASALTADSNRTLGRYPP